MKIEIIKMNLLFRPAFVLTIFLSLMIGKINGQKVRIAELGEDAKLFTYELPSFPGHTESKRSPYQQVENFPFSAPAHPTFKNFRNVTIADINQDGRPEILVCLDETLFVIQGDGSILWEAKLSGTSNYPPAVADVDNDGDLEIALQTYGVPATGNVYLFDHEGSLQPAWPLNISNHLFLNGVTLADLDGNDTLEIIASERINGNSGSVHALNLEASDIDGWPVSIPGTPAITPSVGDLDHDGVLELITSTTTALYVFDAAGNLRQGFPQSEFGSKFSYQSPMLADLDQSKNLEIIGTRHGDLPGTYVFDSEGSYYASWPKFDNIWNYAPPSVVDIDGDNDLEVFFARPFVSSSKKGDILLGYDHLGNELEGFPVQGYAGSEGLVAIADIDNDEDFELITASKASIDGRGLIHAYHSETGLELDNFPIEVLGFTFLNGAFLSDINNDGLLDLTALSYQLKFGQGQDSAFINVFNLDVPYNEATILFNGYKGSIDHTGLKTSLLSSTQQYKEREHLSIYPNPATDRLILRKSKPEQLKNFIIFDMAGRLVRKGDLSKPQIDISSLSPGIYTLHLYGPSTSQTTTFTKQ